MPGFLSQITEKHRKLMEEIAAKAKTIGIKVQPQLYSQLAQVKDRFGLNSMKAAAVRACAAGVQVLLEADPRDTFAGFPHEKGDKWTHPMHGRLFVDRVSRISRGRIKMIMSDGIETGPDGLLRDGWSRVYSVAHGE